MRILFAGTPEIAVPSLKAAARHFEVAGVLTNPDRPKGRGKGIAASPVKQAAIELGIPVLQFPTLKREAREAVSALGADILVVFAYGRIFGPKFLSLFPKGGVNVHPSLLPRHRGCAPIQAAMLAGDRETGITIQRIALEMDTGDIILQRAYEIGEQETAADVSERFSHEGASLLVEALELIQSGREEPVKQDESRACYCMTIRKEHGGICWEQPADQIVRMIRAFSPWPKAYTWWGGKKVMITAAAADMEYPAGQNPPGTVIAAVPGRGIAAAAGCGAVIIQQLQLETKRAADWKSFLNGNPAFIGSRLCSPTERT